MKRKRGKANGRVAVQRDVVRLGARANVGPIVSARLAALDYEDGWAGHDRMLALGALERALSEKRSRLRPIAMQSGRIGSVAGDCLAAIDDALAPAGKGGLADAVLFWPAYIEFFEARATLILRMLERLDRMASTIHQDATRLEVLRERWSRLGELGKGSIAHSMRVRIESSVLGEAGFESLALAASGRSSLDALAQRLDLVEHCLREWSDAGVALLGARFGDGPSEDHAPLDDASATRDREVARGKSTITESGLSVSASARSHAGALKSPSVAMLEHRMRQAFGTVVKDPLRTWIRLLQSKIR